MTYKTRQEVLRAAADWMDVCEKAGVNAKCKVDGEIAELPWCTFQDHRNYEFPLALLEGKEVWVGSELWNVPNNFKFTANVTDFLGERRRILDGKGRCGWIEDCSWNPPKPETVMVEMLVEDAKELETWMFQSPFQHRIKTACKKALENLK